MRGLDWIKRLIGEERGNVLAISAAAMPLLIGSAALAVDTVQLSLARRQLQRTADSGAMAGAYALIQNKDVAESVNHDLEFNKSLPRDVTVIENAPTAGAYANNMRAVRLVLASDRPTPFFGFFGDSTSRVQVEATAAIVYNGKFCMVSLEDGNATGITFSGSATVDLGCGVATNSTSALAVVAGGSSTIVASPVAAVGQVPASSSYVTPTTLLPYSPKQVDPYADLPIPSPSPAQCQPPVQVQPQTTAEVEPGCYKGMDLKGNVTFKPGTYYIDGSTLAFGATANVKGTGVTFVLTSSQFPTTPIATLDMHGNAVLDISAPKTGVFGGVLMYQDPRAALGNIVRVNGNSATRYEGGFYFPRADLTFNGNTGMRTQCLQLVARRLNFTGNSKVSNVCPVDSDSQAFDATFVRLVA